MGGLTLKLQFFCSKNDSCDVASKLVLLCVPQTGPRRKMLSGGTKTDSYDCIPTEIS